MTSKFCEGHAFIPGWLLSDNRVSDGAKITWIVLYKLIRKKRGEYLRIKVSLDNIADLRSKSKMAISRHLNELKRAGYISTIRNFNKPSVLVLHMNQDEKVDKG